MRRGLLGCLGMGAGCGWWWRMGDPTLLPLGPGFNLRCHLPSPHGLLPRLCVLAVGYVFFLPVAWRVVHFGVFPVVTLCEMGGALGVASVDAPPVGYTLGRSGLPPPPRPCAPATQPAMLVTGCRGGPQDGRSSPFWRSIAVAPATASWGARYPSRGLSSVALPGFSFSASRISSCSLCRRFSRISR